MDLRYLLIGLGSIIVGVVDAAVFAGLNRYLGWALIVAGIAVCAKGVLHDPDDIDYDAPMPDLPPGRLCDRCGKMTSLDSSTCSHCGASLTD
jgi:hypothetical protein